MKEFSKKALLIIGLVCLPIIFYKYLTTEGSDLKYIIGIFCSLCLIYGSFQIKTTDKTEIS